jgi:hypothetical protein
VSEDENQSITEAGFKTMVEDLAANALFTLLRGGGHLVEDVRWPDRERRGVKGSQLSGGKTPDLTFLEDGQRVGVDITELHESQAHVRQEAETARLSNDLQLVLRPLVRQLSPGNTIIVSLSLRWLPKGRVLRDGLEMVKATILSAVAELHAGETRDLEPKPDFVEELEVSCVASPTPGLAFFTMHEEQTGRVMQAAESMADLLLASSKPEQLRSFKDARVVAVGRAMMFAEEVVDALAARAERIPANWSAIYFFVPGREGGQIHEVWHRPAETVRIL